MNNTYIKPDGFPAHAAMAHFLPLFAFGHLPESLRAVSEPFHNLAVKVIDSLDGPEATVCLRKLLEAKDCAVRAAIQARAGREHDG